MATRNLRSNSAVPEIWPLGVLFEAPAADNNQDPLLERDEPTQVEVIAPPAHPTMATAPTIEWKTDPFQGKFNPGTKTGHQIFLEKTKGLAKKDKLELLKTNSVLIHKFFCLKEGQWAK